MRLKPSELARKLGVAPSAIRDAETRGRLIREPDGTFDTQRAENLHYLRRFSGHRGKQRQEAPVSPDRSAALLARAEAAYRKSYVRLKNRIADTFPAHLARAGAHAFLLAARGALAALPDHVDLSAEFLEAELERVVNGIFRTVRETDKTQDPYWREVEHVPPLADPDALPADLDGVRAALDTLHARRLTLDACFDDGSILTWEDTTRLSYQLVAPINALTHAPRRWAADLSAAVSLGRGPERLHEIVEIECTTLTQKIKEVEDELER